MFLIYPNFFSLSNIMVNVECDSIICRGQTIISTAENLEQMMKISEVGINDKNNKLINKDNFASIKMLNDLNIDVIWRRLMDDMVEVADKMIKSFKK